MKEQAMGKELQKQLVHPNLNKNFVCSARILSLSITNRAVKKQERFEQPDITCSNGIWRR
jgi:hypothetical protein